MNTRTLIKKVQYNVGFKSGDIIGYFEIINDKAEGRIDTIEAIEDTCVLFITKAEFLVGLFLIIISYQYSI